MTVATDPSRWVVSLAFHAPPGPLLAVGGGPPGIGDEAARCTGRSLVRLDPDAAAVPGRRFPLVLVTPPDPEAGDRKREFVRLLAVGLGRLHPAGHMVVRVAEDEVAWVEALLPTLGSGTAGSGGVSRGVLDVRPCRAEGVLLHIGRVDGR